MAKENSREMKLKYAFRSNSKVEVLHVTSDDQMFTQKGDALSHAKTLEDKALYDAKREKYMGGPSKEDVKIADADKAKADRKSLFEKHKELFGKNPAATAKNEDISKKIEAELAKRADVVKKVADADKGADDSSVDAGTGTGSEADGGGE